MRVAVVIPGSGGSFYCENCLRDSGLTAGLERAGFEAFPVPMYLPLFAGDAPSGPKTPLFYGAIALYLRERFRFFRRLPASFDRLLNARPFLAAAAGLAGSTRAAGLEEMTISMLEGEEGRQAAELEHLCFWLEREAKPDVVHLSNALLVGLARALKARLGAPIVCSLQDEHVWIEPMAEPARARAWALLREKAGGVDRFVAVSDYYRKVMAPRLGLDPASIAVVPLGVDSSRYEPLPETAGPPVIGFLSRMEPASGLDSLVEALPLVKAAPGLGETRLRAYGGMTGDDAPYVRRVERLARRLGLSGSVSIDAAYDRRRRFEFLSGLSALSVPRREPEAFGMFLLEAMAAGVPVAAPDLGGFGELVRSAGGGLLYPAGDGRALAEALVRLLSDRPLARKLREQGRTRARELYSIETTAAAMGEVYRGLAESRGRGRTAAREHP
ncbi:MAG: glycosyltransferase family 4 protein [Spirochaetales bacterium]|nr:glycosyltransferase family 4 protein [Spirochaetales bacterium]